MSGNQPDVLIARFNRLLKNSKSCFDRPVLSKVEGLSMNGKCSTIPVSLPFALRLSKVERWFFNSLKSCDPVVVTRWRNGAELGDDLIFCPCVNVEHACDLSSDA